MAKEPKKEEGKLPPPEAFEPDLDYDPNALDRYDDEYVRDQEQWVSELKPGSKKPAKEN